MYNMVMYYYVLIVFSLHRESLKLILATDPFRGGSVTGICRTQSCDPPRGLEITWGLK
jgi:hypothetical protein